MKVYNENEKFKLCAKFKYQGGTLSTVPTIFYRLATYSHANVMNIKIAMYSN